ncbi:hypothetical protein C8E03_1241 [Lachnotalea glycerini]|uniref:Uncharacterized protein n=1 Tax=Lachnotalea glycerini TaxID=1763509 RepID=A0A318EL72_9FIRM|nr:hypothetical protein C8E03_1241 [Lachnotalea glycerini]
MSPNTMKATAGIGDIVSMPGEIHIKSEPTKTVKPLQTDIKASLKGIFELHY